MNTSSTSVFHDGEIAIQKRLGIHEKMEKFGRRVIRDHMPQQHRDFYQKLPFIAVGHVDKNGAPWASLLVGRDGPFIQSPDNRTLTFHPANLNDSELAAHLSTDSRLGLLGIELATRRRNRMSGKVSRLDKESFTLSVDQAFGNCPQYIQTRDLNYIPENARKTITHQTISVLGEEEKALIAKSDTFFVSSYYDDGSDSATNGADVSHRGGKAGFVHIEENGDLIIPDYAGNNHFNTLGNFAKHPYAGLLFVDFEQGHLLSLTGEVEILWDDPRTEHFNGALRLWRFRLTAGNWQRHALPFRVTFGEFSPNSLLTGDWQQAHQLQALEEQRQQWQPARITDVIRESTSITSFIISPENGVHGVWKAGQFLTIQVEIDGQKHIRTYTLSSAPDDQVYRISVKREDAGIVSRWLHDRTSKGDNVEIRLPAGAFHMQSERPAVLIGAGVGLTPFVSMLRQAHYEVVKNRVYRPITLLAQVRDGQSRPFFEELSRLSAQSEGLFNVIWAMSQPEDGEEKGRDFHFKGRLERDMYKAVLSLDDYDFYLCGPANFMQDQYDNLLSLGVPDERIFAEGFGPAALKRQRKTPAEPEETVKAAESAIVTFSASGVEQSWQKEDGNLLDFAENHGMSPPYSCRNGQCGSCKVRVAKGKLAHTQKPGVPLASDEALLCCAVPADTGEEISIVTLDA